jgi:AraC-like DNA-binding protein
MHRVLPDPSLNVTFACERDADGRVRCPRVFIIGPKTKPYVFRLSPGHELAAVRFKLEWVRALLDLTPGEHNDGANDLAHVAPALAAVLLDAVATARTAEEAMLALAASLERRARRVRRSPGAAVALDVVRGTRGRVGVDELARLTGLSTRHLRRTVRQDACVSIKTYARIVRFLTAVGAADRAAAPAWARLAADCGYFDQSHLVRECQALCGLAPAAIHRERRDEADLSNRRGVASR